MVSQSTKCTARRTVSRAEAMYLRAFDNKVYMRCFMKALYLWRERSIRTSGRDTQQMSDSSSGSGTGTGTGSGSGAGTGSDTRTERASGDRTASEGQPTNGQSRNNKSSEDDTNMVRRAMNNAELRLARSQATVIIHNLMRELTAFVTRSLGGATGERCHDDRGSRGTSTDAHHSAGSS